MLFQGHVMNVFSNWLFKWWYFVHTQVVLYRPNGGHGCSVEDSPPPLPEEGADAIYSFESLPAKHWKKYLYASRYKQACCS